MWPPVQQYWANFARTGTPNRPGLPYWPEKGKAPNYIAFLLTGPVVGRNLRNGPGGKIEIGESPLEAIKREVMEETNLMVDKLTTHGTLRLVFSDAAEPDFLVNVFSTCTFDGRSKDLAGRLQWFAEDRLPFDRMWPDQRYWLPIVLAGGRLDGVCFFDGRGPELRSCELHLELATPAL